MYVCSVSFTAEVQCIDDSLCHELEGPILACLSYDRGRPIKQKKAIRLDMSMYLLGSFHCRVCGYDRIYILLIKDQENPKSEGINIQSRVQVRAKQGTVGKAIYSRGLRVFLSFINRFFFFPIKLPFKNKVKILILP